jgi:hypothetical protein
MPKKTKRQKIIADYRRKIKLLNIASPNFSSENIVANEIVQPVKIEENVTLNQTIGHEEIVIRKFFFQDLKKSLLLIGLVITLEFIFYFASIKNYFGLG